MLRRSTIALSTLSLALGLTAAVATPAAAAEICAEFGSTRVNGFMAQNNRWGASTAQCIDTTAQGFRVSRADHSKATNGAPASYPSMVYGHHYGNASPGTVLPARVDSRTVAGLRTSVEYRFVPNATYNAAYDIWLDPTPRTDGQNTGAELMVWANRQGSIQPIGSRVGSVTLLGTRWEVWFGNIGWNVVSYVRSTPSPTLSFPVSTFIDDAISRGHAQRSWYLTSVQAGFEPWIGGAGLAVTDFDVTTGGAPTTPPTSPPTTPPTAPTPRPTTPTTPPTTAPPAADLACTATYRTVSRWFGGYQGEVVVRNTGKRALSGWIVTGSMPNGEGIVNHWNADATVKGGAVTARNLFYNGSVPKRASTDFGFVGRGTPGDATLRCAAR